MPSKKKGGTFDDAAAKSASFMLPVPAPSSMRAWTRAQAPASDSQLPNLGGYVPVGDLMRDYVFMCKGFGVSAHPCIAKRIRRPMSERLQRTGLLGLFPEERGNTCAQSPARVYSIHCWVDGVPECRAKLPLGGGAIRSVHHQALNSARRLIP